ncbi:acetyltransferase [Dissoconium aciculare CBS 342.82]|uniref:Acetyltransferase n=1 Tax=Dissoconium aciculare CBS 342.82 TaxID=1314786 RepID=A0A6J3MIF5_9PEZI|nr:acetyltransferase [Dissoconium aciculare CBS 342.82]KAF1827700.1 acetyltransferase [Dissoconium aciculare CBS 342.82]
MALDHPSTVAVTPVAINIREANSIEDIAAVAKLGSHVFYVTFTHTCSAEEMRAYLEKCYSVEAIAKDAADPMKDIIVATITTAPNSVDGSPGPAPEEVFVGFAQLTRGTTKSCLAHVENSVELQRLYVHPEYQGRRIGRLLCERVEHMAREENFRNMWLGVWEENVAAHHLYHKLGYKQVGQHVFDVGGNIQTDWVMVKEL